MAGDCGVLVELAAEGAARWTEADFAGALGDGAFVAKAVFVCEEDGAVVGFVAGNFLRGEVAGSLDNVAVRGDWRRKGVARALVDALAAWMAGLGAVAVELEVRAGNAAARAAYAAMGFAEDGVRRGYYAAPVEDGVRMRRELVRRDAYNRGHGT